jgi:glycosyltransferase involved in cell wall biosynthesis
MLAVRRRVLLIAPTFGEYGGIEAFVRGLAFHLAGSEAFAPVVVFLTIGQSVVKAELKQAFECAEFDCHFLRRRSIELIRLILGADLIHVQNLPPDVCLLARLLGKKLVATIHHWRRPARSLGTWAWLLAHRLPQVRLYNSYFVRRTWDLGPESATSCVVRTHSPMQCQMAPFEGRRGFSFVSRLIPNKGADILLEAYRTSGIDPITHPLVMMGKGPLLESLRANIEREHIQGVTLTGFVTDAEKYRYIRQSRWLVVPPNTKEDMGLTPFEARSQGVPCVVTRDGGVPEVAGPSALLCEPGDVASLAEALQKAVSLDDQTYETVAQQTFEAMAAEQVSWSSYDTLYRRLLNLNNDDSCDTKTIYKIQ